MAMALAWGGGLVLGALLSRRGVFGKAAKDLYRQTSNEDLAIVFAFTVFGVWGGLRLAGVNRPLTAAEKERMEQRVSDMVKEMKRKIEDK